MMTITESGETSTDSELPPHVFSIGGKAFGGLLKAERRNQSILVSGESGSGKTEATKFLMQFLTSVGTNQSQTTAQREGSGAVEIGKRILQTNPILESFGNAQTIRNDNSSRFGKFIKIQFGDKNEIVGAQIVSYLLEKVRLLHQNPEERNFHIFYELLEGGDKELLEILGLQKGAKYELLNSYGPNFGRKGGVADKYAQLYVQTVRAFEDTGVNKQEQLEIFKILAALLHLGNVSFDDATGRQEDTTVVTETSRFHLDKCAELMGVAVTKLEALLVSREIKAGMEVMVLKLNPEQAKDICRSLAKAVYGRLFTWLVRRLSDEINYFDSAVSISDEDEDLATIGILDIFGFESLNCNGFEQLCINYANERLQAQFNEFVFVREQQIYIAEGIDWSNISHPSNEACLALFDDKSNGLFSLLDQECLMPKGSNQALSTKFYRYHGDSNSADSAGLLQQPQIAQSKLPLLMSSFSRYLHRTESQEEPVNQDNKKHPFSASKMERVNHHFVVHHFAGRVCYNVEQFVEKNTDSLPTDASVILSSSNNKVVAAIGSDENVDSPSNDNGTTGRRRHSMLRAPSVSAQFKSQLDRLIVQIGRTEAHYVRCLKPNEVKKPGIFDRERMVEQMRSVGVLEAVRIARHGYSVRLTHSSFNELFSSFRCLLSVRDRTIKMHDHDLAQALVNVLMDKVLLEDGVERDGENSSALAAITDNGSGTAFGNDVRRKDVQVGKTLVFCKSTIYNRFSQYRLELRNNAAEVLQKHYRGYRRRVLFRQMRGFVMHVQAIIRGFLGRRQRQSRRWLQENRNMVAKLQQFRLSVAFSKFRRACLESQTEVEMEPSPVPSDDSTSSRAKRRAVASADEDGEMDDELSLLPLRRARSVMPGQQQIDHVSMLSQKIEELDAKCKFLEQLVARKNYEDASRESLMYGRGSMGERERFLSTDGSLYGDAPPSEAGSDVDSIIFNIQSQMDMLRQSIAVKEQVLQASCKPHTTSFSSSTRPTRSSSAASSTAYSNLPYGEAPPSMPSLPLSESQLSVGGSSHGNSRRSGSSLGLPPTPTSSVASSFYQGPSRSSPAHFGGRGMPRIVKWARSTNCYECEEPFNFFVRRHHCRMCGNSFCHEHSSRRVSVFGIGFDDEPVRVCDNCFAEYYAVSQESVTPQYPQQYSGFSSGPLSSSSRLSAM
ncbi:hypothetical protein G195_003645 [Phytophthora kernoviae 00238/432]|uniref:FYVE-type domain-containing protein n=2 Tax=Phytophthora kernoviae TaxID=325452 RepID=A0A8T0M5Q1_9STRA|nr:hypothetical protein G195_003645 [Phytophthora kernoviae 00238/432]KAG2528218.1 hypothetical protein JM16_002957 [Phytophthora kernoviae]